MHKYFLRCPAMGFLLVMIPALLGGINGQWHYLLFATCGAILWKGHRFLKVAWILLFFFWANIYPDLQENYSPLLEKSHCHCRIAGHLGKNIRTTAYQETYVFHLRKIETQTGWQPVQGKIRLQIDPRRQKEKKFQYGESLALEGAFLPLAKDDPFVRTHWINGMRHDFFLQDGKRLRPPEGLWKAGAFLEKLKNSLANCLTQGIDSPEHAAMYQGMVLGQPQGLSRETQQNFLLTSSIHIFSISGLHLSLFAALLFLFMKGIGFPPRYQALCALPLLGFYVCLTGAAPSTLRAWGMVLGAAMAALKWRHKSSENSLGLVAIALLCWNPCYLYHIGFLYSFLLVFFLLRGARLCKQTVAAGEEKIHWLPTNMRSRTKLLLCRGIYASLFIALLAWFGGMGLTLLNNGYLSLGGLILNLLIPLLSQVLLFLSLPKLLLSWLWPSASLWLGGLLGNLLHLLTSAAAICAKIGIFRSTITVIPLLTGIYYLLLLAVCSNLRPASLRIGSAALLLLFISSLLTIKPESQYIQCCGDDGGPSATALLLNGKTILISSPGGKSAAVELVRTLRQRKIDHLPVTLQLQNKSPHQGEYYLEKNLHVTAIRRPQRKCSAPHQKWIDTLSAKGTAQVVVPAVTP